MPETRRRKMNRLIKLGVLAGGILALAAGAIMAIRTPTALATPGNSGACTNCHTYQGGSLRITTNVTNKTVAPGEQFIVNISFTGGGTSRTEVNWPNVLNNSQFFARVPSVPFSAPAATASTSSTLTAPTTPGTYSVRVYATQSAPTMETDYKEMSITVSAPVVTYAITATAGANGSITPSGAVTVNAAANQSFTIAANSGYHIAGVLVDGTSVGAVSSYTFNGVNASHTISASFAADVETIPASYTITATAGANGSITPSGAVTVNAAANQSFTIAANSGYHIAGVLVDGTSVGAVSSYTFNGVNASHTISVTFASTTVGGDDDSSDDHRTTGDDHDRDQRKDGRHSASPDGGASLEHGLWESGLERD
jgi:hypothetical protein